MRGTILALVLLACSTSKTAEHDLHAAQQEDLAGNVNLRLEAEQHAALDEHTIDTAGPVEEVHELLGPDGGVSERTVTRWGGSTSENWLKQALNADEHLELDAGVTVRTSATVNAHDKSDKEMKPAGGCMLGLGFWGAIAIAGACAAAGLYLRVRAKALLP